jgi:large subunit ribosomal protein L21
MSASATHTRYAIFATGGKQYQAIAGKTVAIEKLDIPAGNPVTFDQVLLVRGSDDAVKLGHPFILDAHIKAEVVKHMRGPKLIVYKFKRRKKSRVKRGHRQPITVVRVLEIA